jgi:hypothetical protein
LSNATTPSVLELNDASAAQKNRKTSNEDEQKKYSLQFGYRNSDQAAKNLGQKAKTQLIT